MILNLIIGWIVASIVAGFIWCAVREVAYRRSETRRILAREARLERARQIQRSDR